MKFAGLELATYDERSKELKQSARASSKGKKYKERVPPMRPVYPVTHAPSLYSFRSGCRCVKTAGAGYRMVLPRALAISSTASWPVWL